MLVEKLLEVAVVMENKLLIVCYCMERVERRRRRFEAVIQEQFFWRIEDYLLVISGVVDIQVVSVFHIDRIYNSRYFDRLEQHLRCLKDCLVTLECLP
mmetsp:Transcript_29089/g.39958  ORF Transcript_29089/g.39958 Transcript_29089/m.39958 type:complete len:98 (+) Transcript_29089:1310-1603(+)